MAKSAKYKETLKKRRSIVCPCKRRKQAEKERNKYGTCRCDSYTFCYTVGTQLANALFRYVADAREAIQRDDFDTIERHAQAIMDFVAADSWDKMTVTDFGKESAMSRMIAYDKKEQAWREAMFWLTENWNGLWW